MKKTLKKTKTKESMLIQRTPVLVSYGGHDQLASLFVTDARRGGAKSFGAGDGLDFSATGEANET